MARKQFNENVSIAVEIVRPRCPECDAELRMHAADQRNNSTLLAATERLPHTLTEEEELALVRDSVLKFEQAVASKCENKGNPFVSLLQGLGYSLD